MKKRIKVAVAIVVLTSVVVGLLFLATSRHSEPMARGLTLTEWLKKDDTSSIEQDTIKNAIAEMGTRAIPFLEAKVGAKNSPFQKFYQNIYPKLPLIIQRKLPLPLAYTGPDYFKIEKNALMALTEFGSEARSALPAVIEAARANGSGSYNFIVAALSIGADTPEVKRLINELLKDPSGQLSVTAAIIATGLYPQGMVESLIPEDNGTPWMPNALLALSMMGSDASPAFSAITNAISNPPDRSGKVFGVLSKIGPVAVSAVPLLIEELDKQEGRAKAFIIETLSNIGPLAKAALPKLRSLMTDEEPMIRTMAAMAVAEISGDYQASIEVLMDALESLERSSSAFRPLIITKLGLVNYRFDSRMTAAWFLGEWAPYPAGVLPELKLQLANSSNSLKPLVARAIWRNSQDAESVLPTLRLSLEDRYNENTEMRILSCLALAEMGAAAEPALPDLEAALTKRLSTRRAVVYAIQRIRGENE